MDMQNIKWSDIKVKFGGNYPPKDEKFIELYMKAIKGEIPYYRAVIKQEGIKPYSDFKPNVSQGLKNQMFVELEAKELRYIHVYQEDGKFIMSDDYNTYYTYLELGYPVFACYIMGEPTGEYVLEKRLIKPPQQPTIQIISEQPQNTHKIAFIACENEDDCGFVVQFNHNTNLIYYCKNDKFGVNTDETSKYQCGYCKNIMEPYRVLEDDNYCPLCHNPMSVCRVKI